MLRSAVLFLLFACPAFAQDFTPEVTGPTVKTVTVITAFPFTVSAPAIEGAAYVWQVPSGVTYTESGPKIEITGATLSVFTVKVNVISAAPIVIPTMPPPDPMPTPLPAKTKANTIPVPLNNKIGLVTLTVGAPKPPDPIPPPTPTTKVAWAIVIEESEQRTAEQARVLADLNYWNALKAQGVGWHIYDKDNPHAIQAGYVAKATTPLPSLVMLDKDGYFLRAVPLPKTTAAITEEVKK